MFNATFILSLLLCGTASSNQQLHRPLSDRSFWNPQQLLKGEPISVWPEDAILCPYVGQWKYWFRSKGMTSSTDDVIVSLLAVYPNFNFETFHHGEKTNTCSNHFSYMDMGCGIGSSLLCVAHALRPHLSIGIEAQSQSVLLLQRTLDELPENDRPMITCLHQDLRQLSTDDHRFMWNTFDLITANPPYAKLEEGTLPIDPQRRSARFELRGGIEDYLLTAQHLLKHDTGRMIFSFWNRDDERVIRAADAANLYIHRKIHIKMGKGGTTGSNVYVVQRQPTVIQEGVTNQQLDITRNPQTGSLSSKYTAIRELLNLASRPLK